MRVRSALAACAVGLSATPVLAQFVAAPAASPAANDVYTLGELRVTARTAEGLPLGGSTISGKTLKTFNRQTVDQALDLIPGANSSNTGGSRNERLIFVRGFDRFQTTLSVDGVRVFLPADNRIDFGRFLTADLAEVQVSKGYVSVLDGPGSIGGAVNLVTRRPAAQIEGEFQVNEYFSRTGDNEAWLTSGRIGGRSDRVYWQLSGAYSKRDHFTLSDSFQPTVLENGGERERSNAQDWRINAKVGWTPNATDEYSLNYTRSEGEKNAPYSVTDTASTRFWSWPYWNTYSLAFLSRTRLTDTLTLRTRLYRNTFENLLSAFDDASQTTQSLPRAFNSFYEDYAVGGNVELNWTMTPTSSLKGVFYARQDVHKERQDGFVRTPATGNPSRNAPYGEPEQRNDELTYSVAGEYSTKLTSALDLVLGVSYDWTDLQKASDINVSVTGTTIANSLIDFLPVSYALKNNDAVNGQAALLWRVSPDLKLRASVSDRARLPTLFERFSSRLGTAVPNPDVGSERAINYEVGVEATVGTRLDVSGAVFYSDLQDALLAIPVTVNGFGLVTQTRNVGDGEYYGAEAAATWRATSALDVGGNVTWLHRRLSDPTNPAFHPLGVPEVKLFGYAAWRPLSRLKLRPSVEYASQRWTVTTIAPLRYYKTGEYVLLNAQAEYAVTDGLSLIAAAQNLTDRNYQLTDGFPEAGRSFYLSVQARF